jgi:hypothetical protein
MSRYLIVAHETVTNPELLEQVGVLTKNDPQAEFVLLVPSTPVRHLVFRRGRHQEDEAHVVARKLADKAKNMFTKKGINLVDARVGPESPVDAIDQEVQANPNYAGFVISTLPKEKSRWLQMHLPETVESKYGKPVYHVAASFDWSAGDIP